MMRGAHHRSTAARFTWLVIGLGAAALLVTVSFVRETLQSRQIDREIADLRAESERLRARNFEVVSLTTALGRGEFLEREARTKLGLQKEGERVVVIRKDVPPGRKAAETSAEPPGEAPTNPQRWWLYFTDRPTFDAYADAARKRS